MEFLSPAPDLNRSLATLMTAMDTQRLVNIWVPGIIFHGYVPIKGLPIRVRPEEGSGRWWLVTLDLVTQPTKEFFLKLDEYPRVQFAVQ